MLKKKLQKSIENIQNLKQKLVKPNENIKI